MIQLALITAVPALALAGLVWCFTAAWYRNRLIDADDRADTARDVAADAVQQLREGLTGDFERASREIHGFTAPDLVQLSTYETELGSSPRLARKFEKFAKRTAGADLPNT